MSIRTTCSTVTFSNAFSLRNVSGIQPAGTYDIETEEEVIEGNDRTVYRRVATLLYIRSVGMTRACTIDPKDLAAALAQDRIDSVKCE